MKIIDFFRSFFSRKSNKMTVESSSLETTLKNTFFAIQTGVNLISAALTNCEFQTVINGKETKKEDYYLLNIRPNPKQNKAEFISKLVDSLFWSNEVLIVQERDYLWIADSFTRDDSSALFSTVYKNVTINGMRMQKTYRSEDVIHLTLNNTDMMQLLVSLMNGYGQLIDMATGKYKRAGGRKGVLKNGQSPQGDKEWKAKLDDLYNNRFKHYFEDENALIVLQNGQEYTEISGEGSKKSTSDVTDIINLTGQEYNAVGRAMRIPPSLLAGEHTDLKDAENFALTYALKPLVEQLQTEATAALYKKSGFINGSYIKINTSCIKYIDLFGAAVSADKYLADGVYNVDSIREKLGDLPLNTKASQEYLRTKNYETVESVKGGENSGSD